MVIPIPGDITAQVADMTIDGQDCLPAMRLWKKELMVEQLSSMTTSLIETV